MKHFAWNFEKNLELIETRNISFERVVSNIEKHGYLDLISHPNKEKYPNQKVFIIDIENYAYLAPDSALAKEIAPNIPLDQLQLTTNFSPLGASKSQRVNIRISEVDLELLQERALIEGLPYQTLMSSVLHKYVTGRLSSNI